MIGMAMHYRVEPLEQIVTALSDSLHYALRAPDEVTLQQEIDHLQDYMRILEIRMPDKYRLVVHAAPETLEKRVLSLLLQPLAENAVQHGILNRKNGGTIIIRTEETDEYAVVTVADNGVGIENAKGRTALEEHSHIGIPNVRSRLEEMVEGNMEIESSGRGTTITIRIPWTGGLGI